MRFTHPFFLMRRTYLLLLRVLTVALILAAPSLASATTINFDDIGNGTVLSQGGPYDGFNWRSDTAVVIVDGCLTAPILCGAVVSSPNLAALGGPDSSFSLATPGTFTLNSLYLDVRGFFETLTILGSVDGTVVDTSPVYTETTPLLATLNWTGIDTVSFVTVDGFGPLIDNVTINESTGSGGAGSGDTPSAVPEPATLWYVGTGALALANTVRRRCLKA